VNVMNYQGYAARIDYSDEDGLLVGHIAGIKDVVGFHGESVSELRAAFKEAVTDYLETCAKLGRAPQKPYSGHLMSLACALEEKQVQRFGLQAFPDLDIQGK